MKANKLYIDTRKQEQPEGTYPFAKNGIQFDVTGVSFNEPGFKRLQVLVPYKYMGIIETDSKPVVFSGDNVNSAIGYFNPETETYEPIIDDNPAHLVNYPADGTRLGFDTEFYITGQAQRNYKGEMVITFTDKRGGENGWPKYLNCDNPDINSIDDLRLFPYFKPPDIDVEETVGGRVPSGAYFVAVGYEKNDGTSTPYSAVSAATIVTPNSDGSATDKALTIIINNADTNYDMVRIAIISKVGGVTKAVELQDFYPITGSVIEITYTGDNLTSDIAVESILTQPALYQKVGTIGQLNDYIYIGDLETEPDLNDLQPYAAIVGIEWKSELINATAPPQEHITGKKKSFMHEDVNAFYIRYRKTRGGFTKWFVIVGPEPVAADLVNSTEAATGGGGPVPKYKVEDTISYFDIVTSTGRCGVWQNTTEKYPDTPDFDATALGGRNLRNQPVLHHKMPSIRWCKANLYAGNNEYGKTMLDLLGVRATNVRIPDKYIGVIDGYEIGYAKRTVGNMTVYGQSILLHGVVNNYEKDLPTGTAQIYTSGGNFRTSIWHKGDNSFNNNYELVQLRTNTFRFHAFDILLNKPSIEPSFVSGQLKLHRDNIRTEGYVEDGADNANLPIALLVDYTLGATPVVQPTGQYLRKINNSSYLPNGITAGGFVNARHENVFAGTLAGPDWPVAYGDAGLRTKGQSFTEAEIGAPAFEEAYLANLIAVKTDIYNSFYSQSMVSAGAAKPLTSTDVFWGGDTFLCDYTFHTYGRHETNDGWGDGSKGKKVVHRFVCESVSNIHLRYEVPANQYSKWYPHNPLPLNVDNNTAYVITFDRSQDPNQFGYDKSLSANNDLISSIIYSPYREEITVFPYRIHRGGKNTRTGRPRSWRTFLPLDYYEMQKNMGRLIHLEGMDDRLLIHMENSLFLTQDKAKLDSGVIAVTLGTGDIFQFEPQQALESKLGTGGTQHDLACVKTPMGYVFVDAKQGEMYLYKGTLATMNSTINTFLREYLKIKDKNIFMGNGVTIGWDQKYKRILLTVKNRVLPDGTPVINFEDTPEFWDNIQIGDIVFYQNRYIRYQGLNPGNIGYDCPPDPPVDVYTWEPTDPYCMKDAGNRNTGMQAFASRLRRKNGTLDGYKEPNLTNGGIGPYFPPIPNTTVCPLPPKVTTWIGSDPYCEQAPVYSCPDGWTFDEKTISCVKVESTPATPPSGGGGTPGTVAKANSEQWNNQGSWIYTSWNPDGSGPSPVILDTPHIWVNGNFRGDTTGRNLDDSRMNYAGIWVDGGMPPSGDWTPVNEWIGFSRKITVAADTNVIIGMSADNNFKFSIDGQVLITNLVDNNFNVWGMYQVTLTAGDHFIEMYGLNKGSVAGFAAEIYLATPFQLQACTTNAQIDSYLLFSTKDMVGEEFDLGETIGWSCPDGWYLDTTGAGDPVCRRNLSEPPEEGLGGNSGMKGYHQRCRLIDGIADGFCEENTPSGGTGPFIPPVEDLVTCPTTPPEPPGPVIIAGTVTKTCSDRNCTEQGIPTFVFSFTTPVPANLEIWAGEVTRRSVTGVHEARGYEIIAVDPYPGTVSNSIYQNAWAINIPANVSFFSTGGNIPQHTPGSAGNLNWVCHNCQYPITDLYFKISNPVDGFELNLTYVDNSITVHNVNT